MPPGSVAQRAVEASGGRSRWGGRCGVVRRVERGSREMTLGAHRGVPRFGGGRVGVRGTGGGAPRCGGVRGSHPVAGVAGDPGGASREVVPVAGLAVGEPAGSGKRLLGYRPVLRGLLPAGGVERLAVAERVVAASGGRSRWGG